VSRILLDTDVLIDVLRARRVTQAFLLELTREATPCCSVVTVAELHAGMRESEREPTAALIDSLVVLPVTRHIAEIAGDLRRAIRRSGATIADCLIAATGIVEAMPVATGNVKHFRVPGVTVVPAP
jgi:predicted nucleic acid-binding protein